MNFDLDQEHELVRSTVRAFAQEQVAPLAEELDRASRFPYELVAQRFDWRVVEAEITALAVETARRAR